MYLGYFDVACKSFSTSMTTKVQFNQFYTSRLNIQFTFVFLNTTHSVNPSSSIIKRYDQMKLSKTIALKALTDGSRDLHFQLKSLPAHHTWHRPTCLNCMCRPYWLLQLQHLASERGGNISSSLSIFIDYTYRQNVPAMTLKWLRMRMYPTTGFSLGGWLMGGFLTIGYCLRTIDYCFPIVSGNFCGGTRPWWRGTNSWWGGDPPVPPLGKPWTTQNAWIWQRISKLLSARSWQT